MFDWSSRLQTAVRSHYIYITLFLTVASDVTVMCKKVNGKSQLWRDHSSKLTMNIQKRKVARYIINYTMDQLSQN